MYYYYPNGNTYPRGNTNERASAFIGIWITGTGNMSEQNGRQEKKDLIAQRLIEVRNHLGWSIRDAVEKLGYVRSRYTNWELAIRMPGYQELEDIGTVTGVNPGYFVGWTNRMIDSSYIVLDRTTVKTKDGSITVKNATDVAAYRDDYLQEKNLKAGSLITVRSEDDSMKGVIERGDLALVDMSRKQSAVLDLFAILVGDRVWIRWIRPEINGGYTMSAEDRSQYPDETLSPEQLESLEIIGRVAIIERER